MHYYYYLVAVLLSLLHLTKGSHNFDGPMLHQVTLPVSHAECPTWDPRTNILYFVDIHEGTIYSYHYATKEIHSITLNGEVAPVIPSKKNPHLLIVGVNTSLVLVEWDGRNDEFIEKELLFLDNEKPLNRLNDGKADRNGNLWLGTMGFEAPNGTLSPNDGTLYRINKYDINKPETFLKPVNISNGLTWNSDNTKMYYIDSPTQQIIEFNFYNGTYEVLERKIVLDLKKFGINAYPDGMTIDQDDNLWVALYKGGSVIKVDPKINEILERIPLPATRVTSVMWGGPNLDILFVTTSRYGLTHEETIQEPGAGSVFAITNLKTRGVPVYEADII